MQVPVWALRGASVILSEAPVRVLTGVALGPHIDAGVEPLQTGVGSLELLTRTLYKPTGGSQ